MSQANQDIRSSYRGYAVLGLSTAILGIGGLLTWASVARLDSAAIAQGTIAVETSRRPVQHLEGGLIRAIVVRENQLVKKGALLFEVTSQRLRSQLTSVTARLDQAQIRRERLKTERAGRTTLNLPATLSAPATDENIQTLFRSEQALLEMRVKELRGKARQLDAKRREVELGLPGLTARARGLKFEADSIASEMARVAPLAKRGYYPRNKLAHMRRNHARLSGNYAYVAADITRLQATRQVIDADLARLLSENQRQISQEFAKIEMEIIKLRSEHKAVSDQISRIAVRAPIDGVVQAIQPKSVGDVIRGGETIAEIVPINETLRVVAHVAPTDIDSIQPNEHVQVRVGAFSASRIRPLMGKIINLSRDTFEDEVTKQKYFKLNIALVRKDVPDALLKRLVPGMPADVIIAKGERTVLQYILDPLLNAFAKSLREV